MEHSDIAHGWHLYMDGNAWCAVGPHFQCLAVSPAGFGATQQEAVEALHAELRKDRWWADKVMPSLERFTVH